ncbi:MAG: hypothetical protein J0L60_14630 [Ignavibacteria bacterium]|nr:hypothetical protein [Ignavibacteria bacterium]
MKKIKFSIKPFFFFFLLTASLFAQWEGRISMGLNMTSSANLRDYVNENFASPGDYMADINSMIEFSGEVGYSAGSKLQLALEGAYSFNSFTNITMNGKYELNYKFISPTAMAYYMIRGDGYSFKLGGGLGPRFLLVNEIKPFVVTGLDYTSTGFGVVLKGSGSTALSKTVFAYIGADVRYDAGGTPKNNGNSLKHRGSDLSINSLSFGLKLGISFTF